MKAHPAHPQLSEAGAERMSAGLASAGSPVGTFALVRGFEAEPTLVVDARIHAAAFIGSYEAGRALFDLAAARREPIPFYGELGSVNPVFVTPTATLRGMAHVDAYLDTLAAGGPVFHEPQRARGSERQRSARRASSHRPPVGQLASFCTKA